jgi:hypothetical protein
MKPNWGLIFSLVFCATFWGVAFFALARVQDPPSRYQNKPVSFRVQLVAIENVTRECVERGAVINQNTLILGCHSRNLVILPYPSQVKPTTFTTLFTHETAHVLGWPGSHPTE